MTDLYFENLNDADLRQQLLKYGFPNMPVTETTRSLLIKRLKNHIAHSAAGSQPTVSNRRSLQSPANNSRKQNVSPSRRSIASSRRQTISASVSAKTYANCNNNNKNVLEHPTSNISSNINRDYYLSNEGRSYLNRDYENYTNSRPLASRLTLGDAGNSTSSLNLNYVNNLSSKSSPKIYVPPPILANDMSHFNHSPRTEKTRVFRDTEQADIRNGKETPGVVSRLLKLRDITIGRSQTKASSFTPFIEKHFYQSDSDSDSGSPTRYSMPFNRRYNPSLSNNLWNRFNVKHKFKQSSVPYLLIGCLGLFFFVLAILYMTKPPDMPSTMLEKSTTFTLCEELSVAKPFVNCIENEMLGPSLALNKELIQLLQDNIETHYCRDQSVSTEVSGTEFMKYLHKKRYSHNNAHKLLNNFYAALYLIEHNPQWKIQTHSKRGESQQQLPDIYKKDIHFGLFKPYLPLKCIIFNKMQRFFLIIGSVFLIAVLVGTVFIMWRFWNQRRQLRLKTVDNFIKEIVKELVYRGSFKDNAQGEIIVNHLRDKIIPLNRRKTLLWAWNEALQKLEAGDSRIQFGCIQQNGEEFRTMKWVESILSTSSSSNSSSSTSSPIAQNLDVCDQRLRKKHWQSPAFDNVNKISDPPTPCLKIRHMFEAAEANLPELKQNIMESILEKVGSQCRIYDIQLDRQSCCVYMRCASEKDAGIIHKEINGWWFDNHLVSIKFLRLQRYLVRFPNSTSIVPITIKTSK